MLSSNSEEIVSVLSRFPELQVTSGGTPPVTFTGVEFDSREIKGGELFVALPGEVTHGNQFVEQAFRNGASVCLVEVGNAPLIDSGVRIEYFERMISVTDSLEAFSIIANWWRNRLNTPIIGVTGSIGKTTVKELMAQILSGLSQGYWTKKSYNNHVGVPYTLCHLAQEHSWAVVEMGMNHAGELTRLSKIAEPDAVLITCIAPVHIEFFKDINGIADAKLEILSGLRQHGEVILNFDDEVLMSSYWRALAAGKGRNRQREITLTGFGSLNDQATVAIKNLTSRGLKGISLELHIKDQIFRVNLPIPGAHNAMNIAAALLGAMTLQPDIEIERLIAQLPRLNLPNMRLTVHNLRDGRTIIDDSYNANPRSMQALVDLVNESSDEGKRIGLVLGDMKELGIHAEAAHREVGAMAAQSGIDFLVGVGEWAEELVQGCVEVGIKNAVCRDSSEAMAILLDPRDNDFRFDILGVKASRSVGLDILVQGLLQGN
jgi:UDP-N-acetylmuramoyl-tripeptide--D-alanyl-D-alanine ligase